MAIFDPDELDRDELEFIKSNLCTTGFCGSSDFASFDGTSVKDCFDDDACDYSDTEEALSDMSMAIAAFSSNASDNATARVCCIHHLEKTIASAKAKGFKVEDVRTNNVINEAVVTVDAKTGTMVVFSNSVFAEAEGYTTLVSILGNISNQKKAVKPTKVEKFIETKTGEIQKETPMSSVLTKAKAGFGAAVESQKSALAIAGKLELGNIVNEQVTNRILDAIKLPAPLDEVKDDLRPAVKLVVANAAIAAITVAQPNNDKALFVAEAMQLAGTSDLLDMFDFNGLIDSFVDGIDTNLLKKAGFGKDKAAE